MPRERCGIPKLTTPNFKKSCNALNLDELSDYRIGKYRPTRRSLGLLPNTSCYSDFMMERRNFESADIARLACQITNIDAFRHCVLDGLNRLVGFDLAAFIVPSVDSSKGVIRSSISMDPRILQYIDQYSGYFSSEFEKIELAMTSQKGTAIDTEIFTSTQLKRTQLYQEIMRPMHGRSTLYGQVTLRGRKLSTIVLGRSGTNFQEKDANRLQPLLASLAVAEASYEIIDSLQSPSLTTYNLKLSSRERELLSYVRLGYTNKEIASALDNSPHTVRNQLSRLYKKCEVTTRSELVAFSCGVLPD